MYLTNYEELKRFCEENNRFPNGNRSKEERRLYQFYYVNSHIERFKLLHDMYVKKCHEYSLEELKEFCKKNKRMPTALTNRYEKALYAFYVRHKDEKEFKDLHNKYTKIYKAFTIDDLKKFCEENNRLPRTGYTAESKNEKLLYGFLQRHKNEPEFKQLRQRYGVRVVL